MSEQSAVGIWVAAISMTGSRTVPFDRARLAAVINDRLSLRIGLTMSMNHYSSCKVKSRMNNIIKSEIKRMID